MSDSILIRIEAEMQGAFHILGPGRTSALTDRPIELDTEGYPLIPASSVRGRLRTHLERLLRTMDEYVCTPPLPRHMCPHHEWQTGTPSDGFCRACQIFGSPGRPAAIRLSDLTLIASQRGTPALLRQERTSVTISRRLGTAQEQKLFSTETTAATYEKAPLRFEGAIRGRLDPVNAGWLLASIAMVEHIGGSKARGLGKVSLQVATAHWWRNGQWIAVMADDLITEALR